MTRLKETYEQRHIHDEWEGVYRGNALLDGVNERLLDRLVAALGLPAGGTVLDAGCGVGDHAIRLAKRGYRCIGIDISRLILARARDRLARERLADRIKLLCLALEDLPFPPDSFDAIHCRGVLMHVPDWQRALNNLCRVLKPAGRIVILEDNDASLHAALVLAARQLPWRRPRSTLVRAPGGLEFWSTEGGSPFVARMANIAALERQLQANGLIVRERFPTSLADIARFPSGWARNTAIRLNLLALRARAPARLCKGNCLVAEKSPSVQSCSDPGVASSPVITS